MQNPFIHFVLLLFMQGVFGADETVTEGGSVTLHTGVTEIQNDDVIEWNFGPQNMFLCQITKKGDLTPISLTDDVGFRGRLQVDQKTGSLTIRNTRIRHSGQYKVTISSEQTTTKMFKVAVQSVVGESGGVKSVSVMEGGSIPLQNDVKIQRDDLIVWRFGDKGVLLAKFDAETNKASLNGSDESFRDRLQLDHQTGSLTITNTRTTDSGLYELQTTGRESSQQFLLSVKAVPDPGLSSGAVAGIVVVLLLLFAAAAGAGVIYYRHGMSKVQKQKDSEPIETVECVEGHFASLPSPVAEMQEGDQIQCKYKDEKPPIATIIKKDNKTYINDDIRFRGRLQLDYMTGSLIIRNLRETDGGLYLLQIKSKGGTSYRKYKVTLCGDVKTVPAEEGKSVTLETDITPQSECEMHWSGRESGYIASITIGSDHIKTFAGAGERFRDRLELDKRTGSLTIKNVRTEHTGLYELRINYKNQEESYRKFNVIFQDSTNEQGVLSGQKEVKSVSVKEGETLELITDTKIQANDEILVMFGTFFNTTRPYDIIARFSKWDNDQFISYGGFTNRLELDQTGTLKITNTGLFDTGVYQIQITNKKEKSFKSFTFKVAVCAVIFADMDQNMSVKESNCLTLQTYITDVKKDDQILWTFGPEGTLIAKGVVNDKTFSSCDEFAGESFRDRLKLDPRSGSLTIINTRIADSGLYKVQLISDSQIQFMRFSVTVSGEIESMSVTKGKSVTLTTEAEIQSDDLILWTFGFQRNIIAKIKIENDSDPIYDVNERFTGRLKLEHQPISLTITNTKTTDSGFYELHVISGRNTKNKRFDVEVHESDGKGPGNVLKKLKADSTENGENESGMPLMIREDVDVVNEQAGTSSL